MSDLKATKEEVEALRRAFSRTTDDVVDVVAGGLSFGSWVTTIRMTEVKSLLDRLRAFIRRWAKKVLERLYWSRQRATGKRIRGAGAGKRRQRDMASWMKFHERKIDALLHAPRQGFVWQAEEAVDEIAQRVQRIGRNARLLRTQKRLLGEAVEDSFFRGRPTSVVKEALLREILSDRSSSELLWTSRAASLPTESVLRDFAELPYVKIPTRTARAGYRRLRVDHYAELLARTHGRKVATQATRAEIEAHGGQFVQVSLSAPLQDDACWLYVGRVFALTPGAAAAAGVAAVGELPNGGTPFHPNCTHAEIPYFPDLRSEEERALVMTRPPAWALGRPFGEVQKEWLRRGGVEALDRWNPAGSRLGSARGGRIRLDRERQRRA